MAMTEEDAVTRLKNLKEGSSTASALLEGRPMPRREFLAGAGATAAAAFLGAGVAGASGATPRTAMLGGTLDIYTWPDYFSAKNLSNFKKLTGTTINQSTYESNDAMFAKLAATNGDSGFDMAIPTSGWIEVMVEKGMLQEIDHDKVPFKNVNPQLLNKSFDPGNKYSVPKDYGYDGVVYDPAVVTKPIKTWMDVIDAIKGQASGKSAYQIEYGTIAMGLWALGYSMNDTDKAHLNEAADLMKTTAKHVKTFDGFDVTGMVSGELTLMVSDQSVARQVLLQKPSFKFVVPGPHSELWVDNYTILTNAAHTAQAYAFVDFQLEPSSQVTDTEFIGYPTVLKNLPQLLPTSTKLRDVIFIPPAVYDTLETFIVRSDLEGYIEDLANQVQAAA
jgi:spermidine/putrescine transport system substrate-binding protein